MSARAAMRSMLLLTATWLALAGGVAAATAADALGPRHHEPAGGFSYCPPKGWAVQQIPGMQYKCAIFLVEGFTPNITVVDEAFSESLDAYVEGNVRGLQNTFPDYKEVSQAAFTTTSGLTGKKLVVTFTKKDKPLRESLFFIDGGNGRKYYMMGLGLAADGDKRDAPFAAAAKSFEIEKPAEKPKTP